MTTVWAKILGEDTLKEPGRGCGCGKFPLGWMRYVDGHSLPFFAQHQTRRQRWVNRFRTVTVGSTTSLVFEDINSTSTTLGSWTDTSNTTAAFPSLVALPYPSYEGPTEVLYSRPNCTRSVYDLILAEDELGAPVLPPRSWSQEDLARFQRQFQDAPGTRGSLIARLQQKLGVRVDGIMGAQTRQALVTWAESLIRRGVKSV